MYCDVADACGKSVYNKASQRTRHGWPNLKVWPSTSYSSCFIFFVSFHVINYSYVNLNQWRKKGTKFIYIILRIRLVLHNLIDIVSLPLKPI